MVNPTQPVCLLLIKLTIQLQFLEMFWPIKRLRMLNHIGVAVICTLYGAIAVALLVLNIPQAGQTCAQHILSSAARQQQLNLTIPLGLSGVVTDVFLLLLPIKAVAKLNMPLRRKVGVLFIFMTGFLYVKLLCGESSRQDLLTNWPVLVSAPW